MHGRHTSCTWIKAVSKNPFSSMQPQNPASSCSEIKEKKFAGLLELVFGTRTAHGDLHAFYK